MIIYGNNYNIISTITSYSLASQGPKMSSIVFAIIVLSYLPQKSSSLGCTDNAIRLSDGRNEQEGRLELCQDGVWGTVCNDPWSEENTIVVCRQLGLGDWGYYLNRFPFGAGPILLARVQCTGEESQLTDCPSLGQNDAETTCDHLDDVKIVCIPSDTPSECDDGSLRLMDGTSSYNGRLEICQVGVWGTICNHNWDRNDAIVACRQLGINATSVYVESHGGGSGPILLSGLSCVGNEDNIMECPSELALLHDVCTHRNDVGVFCSVLTEPECTDGDLRLVDGRTEYEGRVEVCQDGLWGSVCDNFWLSTNNGLVACHHAGINASRALFGVFSVVNGPIFLTSVQCNGTEESLFNCSHTNIRDQNVFCYPSEPVGVICSVENDTAECVEPSLRLVDSSGLPAENSGLVEMCVGGRWSRVCHLYWDRTEATVVCNELGFSSTDAVGYLVDEREYIGPVVSASCDDVITNENSSIYSCISNYNCPERFHSYVICAGNSGTCVDGDLRLVASGANPSALSVGGRLEMCYRGVWGTVCDDGWRISNAIVACRQLGYKTEGARFIFEYNPAGVGPLILDDLFCTGAESTMLDCPHSPLNRHNCGVQENVGLYCDLFEEDSEDEVTGITNLTTKPEPGRTTTGPVSSFNSTPIVLVGIGILVLLLVLVVMMVMAVFFLRRRTSKRAEITRDTLDLSTTNPIYNSRELTVYRHAFHTNASNDYNLDVSSSTGVHLRTQLSPPAHPNVRGSFIRKITEDFIIPLKNLTLLMKIGEGEFGVVYKAKFSCVGKMNEVVAVKTLKGTYSQEEVNAMLEECLMLKHFQHANVLSLIGVCVEAGPAPYIVMPFMSNGSLLSYLRQEKLALVLSDNEDEEIIADVTKRLTTMCQQISKGMEYLASEKFIHRDLAARNCMIDEHYMIKIADFGLSEDIYSKTYFRQQASKSVKLPVKWMALESLEEGVFSEKTDVWAYGVTCWEVFSGGKNPYPGISPMSMVELLERGERLMQPNNAACTKRMYALMRSCWEHDPCKRPTFSKISKLLDKYLEELAGYMSIGCLFPGMQHQQDPQTPQLKDELARKKSHSIVIDTRKAAPTARKDFAVSISVISPQGAEQFL